MGVVRRFEGDGCTMGEGCDFEDGNIGERIRGECSCMCCKI